MTDTNPCTEHRSVLGFVLLTLGACITMGCLWGGSYVMHQLTIDDWRSVPALLTFMFAGMGGIALCGYGSFRVSNL